MTNYTRVTEKMMRQSSPIAYWVEGDTESPPVVLLTGFTGTHGDLLDISRFLKENFFVIIPEFPGWGDTPVGKHTFTIHDSAEVVGHLLEGLGIEKTAIVGHCMGATVAIECAALFPEKINQLILLSPPYQNGTWGQKGFSLLKTFSEKAPKSIRPLFYFWRSRLLTIPMSFFVLQTRTFSRKLHIILKTLTSQSHQIEHVLETNWNSLISYDYQKAKKITLPVHIFHGEKDALVSPSQGEKLSHIFPHATFALIPHAGHLPPVETPETVASLLKKYLI